MKNIKSFGSFLNEGIFDFFKGHKYEIGSPVSYRDYIIPVYINTKTGENLLGHPRPKDENPPYISKLLAYKTNKMNSLKKAIDVMVDKENHPDWEDYQSADTGIDMSGTPVPSIFPEEDELINNPEFKGYAIP
jgi:hypothetical protein